MSKKFVTEEQLSEVVDLIVKQENYTLDKVKALMESHSGGGDAEELDKEELNEISENWGDPKTEADYVVNSPSL